MTEIKKTLELTEEDLATVSGGENTLVSAEADAEAVEADTSPIVGTSLYL